MDRSGESRRHMEAPPGRAGTQAELMGTKGTRYENPADYGLGQCIKGCRTKMDPPPGRRSARRHLKKNGINRSGT